MAKSNTLETNTLTQWLTTIAAPTRPTTWYIALFTADPTDADITANEVDTTVDDTAYARQQENVAGFTVTGDSATNTDELTFPVAVYGTGAAPYDVTHAGVYTALTGGTLLYHTALDSIKTVIAGDQANFAPGDLTITEN